MVQQDRKPSADYEAQSRPLLVVRGPLWKRHRAWGREHRVKGVRELRDGRSGETRKALRKPERVGEDEKGRKGDSRFERLERCEPRTTDNGQLTAHSRREHKDLEVIRKRTTEFCKKVDR